MGLSFSLWVKCPPSRQHCKTGFHSGNWDLQCSRWLLYWTAQLNICLGTETLQSFLLRTEQFKMHIRNGNTGKHWKYGTTVLVHVHILILKKCDDDRRWEQTGKGTKFILRLPEFWKCGSGIILHSTVVGHYKGEQNHYVWCMYISTSGFGVLSSLNWRYRKNSDILSVIFFKAFFMDKSDGYFSNTPLRFKVPLWQSSH